VRVELWVVVIRHVHEWVVIEHCCEIEWSEVVVEDILAYVLPLGTRESLRLLLKLLLLLLLLRLCLRSWHIYLRPRWGNLNVRLHLRSRTKAHCLECCSTWTKTTHHLHSLASTWSLYLLWLLLLCLLTLSTQCWHINFIFRTSGKWWVITKKFAHEASHSHKWVSWSLTISSLGTRLLPNDGYSLSLWQTTLFLFFNISRICWFLCLSCISWITWSYWIHVSYIYSI